MLDKAELEIKTLFMISSSKIQPDPLSLLFIMENKVITETLLWSDYANSH